MSRLSGYRAVHDLLRRRYGSARHHACAWCGRTADQWAYQHTDPAEIHDGRLWSVNESHYRPMCRKCHQRLDSHFRAVAFDRCLLAERVKSLREQAWAAVTDDQREHECQLRKVAERARTAFEDRSRNVRLGRIHR